MSVVTFEAHFIIKTSSSLNSDSNKLIPKKVLAHSYDHLSFLKVKIPIMPFSFFSIKWIIFFKLIITIRLSGVSLIE